jgi:Tol biopolymer transport system component/tRNA A-37 threonylcarbamoyl transferase component Bud32
MPDIPNRLAAALADRYRLERELGQGGMATVYLAEDLKHHRKVALKVLRPELAATLGPERFLREIELAAKLQHPHILPLHDSGEAQGFLYYVMPFVDGENLRGRLARRGELPIQEAVRLLAEVADALSYAHAQGVVHRDIKPDNVLLSGRHALVTDFGVAKAVSEATGRQNLTTAGLALGTPTYMAPEQAAGDPHIDHRADIYALGTMGYELLTGTPPFTGEWPQEILAAHVTQPPEPITMRRPQVPPRLASIVMKCLAKRPDERWQSADELVSELEQQVTPSGGLTPARTQALPTWQRPAFRWVVPALLGLVGLGGALLLFSWRTAEAPALGRRSAVTLEPGLETNAAISPDGKLVAYSRITPAESRLVVQQLAGGEPVTVGSWPGLLTSLPAWSPDGARLVLRSPRGIEVVPALGGVPRVLVPASAELRPAWGAWAPKGDAIAYTSADTIYVRDLDADTARVVALRSQAHSPVWSPDGTSIAFVSGNMLYPTIGNLAPSSIWVVPAQGGTPIRITDDRPLHISPAWLPDSRGLLYVSDQDGGRDVYFVRLSRSGAPEGAPSRITTGLHPHTISLSADGKRLVYGVYDETANVFAIELRPDHSVSLKGARPVTSGSQVIEAFSVSPDRRWLVFDSNRNGNQDIWRMPLGGSAPPEPIATGPEDEFQPAFSPDGKYILFHAVINGSQRDVYRVPLAGGRRTRIPLPSPNNLTPRMSPDGRSLLYTVWGDQGDNTVRAIRRAEGDTAWENLKPVFSFPSVTPGGGDWSPNGRWVSWSEGSRILRADADGGNRRVLADVGSDLALFYTRWKGDSRTVYFSGVRNDGTYVIEAVPATGGPPREVAHSEGPTYQSFRFVFNVVGDTLYVVLADKQSDIWLAELVRK